MSYYSSSCGNIELEINLDDAKLGSHQGRCDDDIDYLLTLDYIKKQFDGISADLLVDELLEYGAWDDTELLDHEENKARLLWIACGEIVENNS